MQTNPIDKYFLLQKRLIAIATFLIATANPASAGSIFDFDDPPVVAKPATQEIAPVEPIVPKPNPVQPIKPIEPAKPVQPTTSQNVPEAAVPTTKPIAKLHDIPRRAVLEQASKLLKDAYKEQMADKSLLGRQNLAKRLLKEAANAKENPADQYALLNGAINAARESASLRLVLYAIDEMAKSYPINPLPMRTKAAMNMPLKADISSITIDNILAGMELIDGLCAEDDFSTASKLCAQLRPIAVTEPMLNSVIQKRQQELDRISVARERIGLHIEKLKTAPNDPVANSAVGLFQCVYGDKWPEGLAMLSIGSDVELKKLAIDDLTLTSSTPVETILKLGDSWWNHSAKYPPETQSRVRNHAMSVFAKGDGRYSALQRARVDKRIAELKAATSKNGNALAEIILRQKQSQIKDLLMRHDNKAILRTPFPMPDGPLQGEVIWPNVNGGYALKGQIDVGFNAPNHGNTMPERKSIAKAEAGFHLDGGTIVVQNGLLDLSGDAENPIVIRNAHIGCEFVGYVRGQYVIFENCSFAKEGTLSWNGAPSAKFELTKCLLVNCEFNSFSILNSGIKWNHCSFVGCKFADRNGRPTPKDDSLAMISHEWNQVLSCEFYGCDIAGSFMAIPRKSNFYRIKLTDNGGYRSEKDLTIELGLPGDDQQAFLDNLSDKMQSLETGKITFIVKAFRFETDAYPK